MNAMNGNGKGTSHRPQLSIVGGGAWGVALATAAASAGTDVLLHSRRPHPELSGAVRQTDRLADLAKHGRTILLATPSTRVRELARELGDHLDGHHIIVHGIRGLIPRPTTDPAWEGDDLLTVSAVLREETPARRFGALGGPVLTEELAKGLPSVLVAASHYPEVLAEVRRVLGTTSLRVYTTDDLLGLEWAAALTSILAIAIGFARGSGVGAGLVSAFAIRGVHEAARVAMAAGANERTFLGLGGFGDLLAAMSQGARPEVRLGEALARGETMEHALSTLGQRIEAVDLAKRVAEFAERHKVGAPILKTIAEGILERAAAPELMQRLMTAPMANSA